VPNAVSAMAGNEAARADDDAYPDVRHECLNINSFWALAQARVSAPNGRHRTVPMPGRIQVRPSGVFGQFLGAGVDDRVYWETSSSLGCGPPR
jgi:hypothetical protein